jgi:Tfp pilus assembly protein PilF
VQENMPRKRCLSLFLAKKVPDTFFYDKKPSKIRLAQAYLETGQYNLARSTALSVIDIDPSTKAEVDAFIAKIPQN